MKNIHVKMEKKNSRENNCAFFRCKIVTGRLDGTFQTGSTPSISEILTATDPQLGTDTGLFWNDPEYKNGENSGEKWRKTFLEKILVKNGQNSGEKWRKNFLEKILVKNGENYMVDTRACTVRPAPGGARELQAGPL